MANNEVKEKANMAAKGILAGVLSPLVLDPFIQGAGMLAVGGPTVNAPTTFNKLVKVMDAEPKPKLGLLPSSVSSGRSFYSPRGHVVVVPKKVSPFVLAHELGHASGGLLKDVLQVTSAPLYSKLKVRRGMQLASLGFLAHAVLAKDKDTKDKETKDKPLSLALAPAVVSVDPVLTQLEELRATLKARRFLNAAKVESKNLLGRMLAQQSNYLLHGVRSVAPIAIGSLMVNSYLNRQKDKS